MAISVIAQFKSIVDPHLESVDPLVDLSKFVELLFVDEPNRRNLLVAERGQQLRRHLGDSRCGQ